jgi:Fe-S cluster assembly protein SufD
MAEKPRVIVSTPGHRAEAPARQFSFTEDMLAAVSQDTLKDYRAQAWRVFNRLSMPMVTQEAWRRTDLRGMPADIFRPPAEGAYRDYPPVPDELLQPLVSDQHGGQVVLMPGGSQIDLDPKLVRQGVVFTDLLTAERQHPELVTQMAGDIIRPDDGKFAALAGALAQNGVVLYIPKGVVLEQPLHSLLWGPGANLAHISHLLVWVDEGASVTYVHEAASPTEVGAHALHAGLVEIRVGDSANLRFVELQSWGEHVWNFSHERIQVGRDASLDWVFGAIGSRLTKNFSDLDLVGEGATGRMSGFYFTDGEQHLDHDTQQNHLAPHTTSDLLFKGALTGKSRSVWQGMIYVAPGAQKTDGYQANRNLILSSTARADSIPGLEIAADDVRCTHGATVGKIEEEPLFYLQSRGLPYKDAQRLIVEGFFDPIMQRIPFEGVRKRFQQAIEDKTASI